MSSWEPLPAFCVMLRVEETNEFLSALHEFAYTHKQSKTGVMICHWENAFPLALALFLFMSRGDNKINVENARHFGMGL
jgi:hypothetical protein